MGRTKKEIVAEILKACLPGASKTAVVYGSNLNFRTVNPYLDLLIKNGLISAMDGRYKTTDKAKKLLVSINKIREFF